MKEQEQHSMPLLTVNAQYIKDLSFENPNSPLFLNNQTQPSIDLDLEISVNKLRENMYEVVLKTGAKAIIGQDALFVVELQYAGIFTINEESLSDEEREVILSVNCPHLLFPYARRILSGVTIDGGFPPLMISPVDFLTLYKQRKGSVDEQLIN